MKKQEQLLIREEKYRKIIERYRELNRQKTEIEDAMNNIKEEAAQMLHEDKINEKVVELSDGEEWKAGYQSSSRSNADLKVLMEIVGPQKYDQIVTNKTSTFLVIKKAGKKKKSKSLTSTKPVEDSDNHFIPDGIILS